MAEHRNIVDRMIGLEEKREFHEFENRAQKLGENYYEDYKELKKLYMALWGNEMGRFQIYFWTSS